MPPQKNKKPLIDISVVSSTSPLMIYLKKKRESERFVKMLESIGTFSLITIFVVFAIRPTVLTISSLYTEIETKKKLRLDLKKKIDQVVVAQNNFAEFQKRYHLIETTLPVEKQLVETSLQYAGVFEKNNQQLRNISFGVDVEKPKGLVLKDPTVELLAISAKINSNYQGVLEFLRDFKNLRRLNYFNSIRISSSYNEETKKTSLSLSFSPYFFYQPPTEEPKNNAKK